MGRLVQKFIDDIYIEPEVGYGSFARKQIGIDRVWIEIEDDFRQLI